MDRDLKICLVSQEYPEETGWGGIGTYTYELAHGLARRGQQVIIIARAIKRETVYTGAHRVTVYRILPRLNVSRLPVLWRLNRLWEGYRLAVALELSDFRDADVIETPALHGETVLFQLLHRRCPVVVRIHSCSTKALSLSQTDDRFPLKLSRWSERQSVRLAHGLTAPSQAAVEDNRTHLPLQQRDVTVIPNPIDTRLFHPVIDHRAPSRPLVLFVGRLTKQKGAHILGKAMPRVWECRSNVRFVFIGRDGTAPDGRPMREWILDEAPEGRGNQVEFINYVSRPDLVSMYQQATLVTLPSLWESFGYIILEAMACGRPVVATRSGGPREIIEDGRTGFLVPPGDSNALAEKILELLADRHLCEEVGKTARAAVVDCYDSKIITKRMIEYYRSLP